jgi:ribosomal protein S18 acetylase RimI-like enzyme
MMIRTMTIDDYEAVYQLWSGTAGVGMRSLDDSREGVGKFLTRNPTTCFVAEQDGSLLGVTLAGHDGRRGYIYHTAVSTLHRGRKIGRELIAAVIEAMRKEQINKIALVIFADNENGKAFWEALGFKERTDLGYMDMSINDSNI